MVLFRFTKTSISSTLAVLHRRTGGRFQPEFDSCFLHIFLISKEGLII